MRRSTFALALAATLSALAACGGNGGGGGTGGNTFTSSNSGTGGAASSASSSSSGGNGGGGNLFDAGSGTGGNTGGAGPGKYLIYASTDTDLFTLDPLDPQLPLTQVGTFDCIDPVNGPHTAMVDIAVDRNDALWGVTGHNLYPLTIQGTTVHCGTAITLNSAQPGMTLPTFYALTFAPEGVLDPAKEVLVAGNSAGELWAIDANGNTSVHGNFGAVPADDGHGHPYPAANVGKPFELSGDIVFLANNGSPVGFATVRDCPSPPSTTGCSKIDTLIEIDMAALGKPSPGVVTKAIRGQIVKRSTCADPLNNGYGSMYGIAAWDDQVYGFSRTGNLVPISNVDGSACLKQNYAPNNFSGAAVTTQAPVKPPPPVN
ncbi:MAG: hypothetical protein QM820_37025 [Minicystis sp.]